MSTADDVGKVIMSKDMSEFAKWRSSLDDHGRSRVDARKAELARAASLFHDVRVQMGLTQVQAAERLETTQANVSKMERRPTVDLRQISKLAGDEYEVVVVLRDKASQQRKEFAVG